MEGEGSIEWPSLQPTDPMHPIQHSAKLPAFTLVVVVALGSCFLSSCASTTDRPPAPGMAMFDATPDAERRDRIDGIRVASINGRPVRGSEHQLAPGRNRVRVGFKWPQGGDQEVDLPFNARPNKTYVVYYDVHPPYVNRLEQGGALDAATGELVGAAALMDVGAIVMLYPIAATGAGAVMTRVGHEIAEDSKPASYVDVMVVAQRSLEGVTCRRRVFPDGRIESR